jgi:hypothetical protein
MKKFAIVFRFTDRDVTSREFPLDVEGSSLPVAVAKAVRTFWKPLDRKARFDALKNGLSIAVTPRDETNENN